MKFSSACLLALAATPCASGFVLPGNNNIGTRPSRIAVTTTTEAAPEVTNNNEETTNKSSTLNNKVEMAKADEEKAGPSAPVATAAAAVVKSKPVEAAKPAAVAPVFVDVVKEKAVRGGLEPGRYAGIDYSITLPFLPRPTNLDGSHAGDFGFDPLGLSQEYDLYYMQECELRHARLAMLAVVGWPVSELLAPDFMLQDGRAPSVLNGCNPIAGASVVGIFAALGVLEYATALRRTWDTELGQKHKADMAKIWDNGVAGDYNFDPMDFYSLLGDDADGRKGLRQLEVTQGRYAMLGITAFAAWEAVSGSPIVENNIFFTPNLVLPVLGAAYLALTTLYEFSDLTTYPIKLQKSKLGLELDEWLERRAETA